MVIVCFGVPFSVISKSIVCPLLLGNNRDRSSSSQSLVQEEFIKALYMDFRSKEALKRLGFRPSRCCIR